MGSSDMHDFCVLEIRIRLTCGEQHVQERLLWWCDRLDEAGYRRYYDGYVWTVKEVKTL